MKDLSSILSGSFLGPFAAFFWVAQLVLIVHVLRTGRPYWWIWILFAAPLIGGLAYFFVELAPSLRGTRGSLARLKPRKWRISDCRRELEDADTVKNRLALAAELSDAGLANEAHGVAVECLHGVFKDDARTLVDVAEFKVAISAYQDALALLNRVDTTGDRMLSIDLGLLKGDCLSGLGRYPEAETAYEGVMDRYVGEAVRAGLANVYEHTGRPDQGAAIWMAIRAKYRSTTPSWRRSERKWYKMAVARAKAAKR